MSLDDCEGTSIFAQSKKGLHTGILLAPRMIDKTEPCHPYLLIVEHKQDHAEKVGFLVLNGYIPKWVSDIVHDPAIVQLLPWARKSIRLG